MYRLLVIVTLLLPFSAKANFLLQYGLNYSSQNDSSSVSKFESTRVFHKAFLAGAVNGNKTLFLGWNINSWSSNGKQGTSLEDKNSLLEMGPRLQWFLSDEYRLYFTAEWNPYAKGEREKVGTKKDISGSSVGFGVGYRFRLSRLVGFGAALHYHSLSIDEEKINSSENEVSDGITNLMPMLELTILTR